MSDSAPTPEAQQQEEEEEEEEEEHSENQPDTLTSIIQLLFFGSDQESSFSTTNIPQTISTYLNNTLNVTNSKSKCVDTSQLVIKKYTDTVNDTENIQSSCPITHITFKDGDEVTSLPCNHLFDTEAINKWVKKKPECPICRFALKVKEQQEEEEEGQTHPSRVRRIRRRITTSTPPITPEIPATPRMSTRHITQPQSFEQYETELDSMTFQRLFEFYNYNNINERVLAVDDNNVNDDEELLQMSLIESLGFLGFS